ncbi:MAG: phage scaffolding protein [Pseudomonadota bacterium]|nr:phage scaffolding protein [Pseudomonadota bacterium]
MTEPTNTPTPPAPPAPKAETFSREYVQELREENKAARLKAQELEASANAAKELATKAEQEAAEKIQAHTVASDARIIRAELKAEAIKHGMIDMDGLKLADLSAVKLDENGEVIGADDLMKKLKEEKPYLFKAPSSSNPNEPPKPGDTKPKKATEMTKEERQAALRQLGVTTRTN